MPRNNEHFEQLRAAVTNLFPQRHSPYCRNLLKSTLRDIQALYPKARKI